MFNPIAFLTQSNKSLMEAVREALINLNCPESKLNNFDQFSTISIKLDGVPDIHISVCNDRLWVWSELGELSEHQFLSHAGDVLSVLTSSFDNVETGQLILGSAEGKYELKALVNPACLGLKSGLSSVVESFHIRLNILCQFFMIRGY